MDDEVEHPVRHHERGDDQRSPIRARLQ